MTSRFQGIRALAAGIATGALTAFWGAAALAEDLVGQPTNGSIGLQPGVTPLRHDAIFFHNDVLLPIITAISLLVLGLLLWCIVRFNKRANPTPATWSHNTTLEVAWTLIPVLILVFIAVFSFRLLFAYEYPDQKIPEFVSNILPEDKAKAKGVPFRLAATEPLVVPVNKVVKVNVTGADVIHAFAVPAFGIITDAVPGRVNQTWFKVEKTGTYYGQCRELCGVDHAFMPIEVKVVTQAEFDAWVASKTAPKAAPAADAAKPADAPTTPAAPAVATPAPTAPAKP